MLLYECPQTYLETQQSHVNVCISKIYVNVHLQLQLRPNPQLTATKRRKPHDADIEPGMRNLLSCVTSS